MKKLISVFAAGLLVLAFAAPVAADTVVDGNATIPTEEAWQQPDSGFIAVCTYPGDKASNWLINGFGGKCASTGGKLKILPEAALKGMIKS